MAELCNGIDLAAGQQDPAENLGRKRAWLVLQHALGKLTEDKASVFVKVELEGMTVPEIAESLNANVNTIYARLRAARQAVGRALAHLQDRDAGTVDAPDAAKGGWASSL